MSAKTYPLVCGRTYRAVVKIPHSLKPLASASAIRAQMALYQLDGTVAERGDTYIVTAKFGGATGVHNLPEQVQSVDLVR